MTFTTQQRFRFVLIIQLLILVALSWPGHVSSDSNSQWQMALSGVYSDHHPPMMSVVWGLFLPFFNTSGWILLIHFIVLGIGIDYLGRMHAYKSFTFCALLIPFLPQVLIYLTCVWKDVGLAVSFFTAASILSFHTFKSTKPTWLEALGILSLLAYGAAVKYQGQFCVFPLCLWFFYVRCSSFFNYFSKGIVLFSGLLLFVTGFNSYFLKTIQKSYSWQYVKLFDIAAISVDCNEDFIPHSYRTSLYSFEKLKELTNSQTVDTIALGNKAIVTLHSSANQHDLLMQAWYNALLSHPISYIIHRFKTSGYMYCSVPEFSYYINFINPLRFTYPILFKMLYNFGYSIGLFLIAHLLLPFFTLFYMYQGIKRWRHTVYGPILFFSSATSFALMGILFFMSLAGVPRYTYMCALLMGHCHVIAYYMYKQRKLQTALQENNS